MVNASLLVQLAFVSIIIMQMETFNVYQYITSFS